MPDISRLIAKAQEQIDAGQLAAAKTTLLRACASDATSAHAASELSLVLIRLGEPKAALYYATRAAKLDPTNVGVACDVAAIRVNLGEDKAVADLEALTSAYPQFHKAQQSLIGALLSVHRTADAEVAAIRALQQFPDDEELITQLAATQFELAMPDRALASISRLRRSGSSNLKLLDFQATLSNYASLHDVGQGANTPESIFQRHRAMGEAILAEGQEDDRALAAPYLAPAQPSRAAGAPLRVGLVSGDFRRHSVSKFLQRLFEHHDRRRIELYAYSTSAIQDEVTSLLRPLAARWRDCSRASPREIDRLMRIDTLDVAIELGGYTGLVGLAALRRHPAAITATYLGYPNTTGCPFVDVRLVDRQSDPPGAEALATERLVRMARDGADWPFLCYAPDTRLPPLRPRPPLALAGQPDAPVVFGCYTVIPKISLATLDLWSRVIRAVPNSVLVIKSDVFKDPPTRARIEGWWREHGVPTERLILRGTHASYLEHLDSYNDLHIALDPTPYNGTTSTCDALAMSTPVLALRGSVHAARVSASILTHSGLEELIADTPEQYAALAARLAGDRAHLAHLHATVRERFLNGKVCDGPGFCRAFEQTIEGLCAMSKA
ncbi:MAG: hypothetical protein MUE97_01205 [Phycisphaerales bacterium]|nr:hypothetical protein [Phycisphaerales bacterium]